ncbi:MAG: EamA family transporter [bacterium]|nr:EamA family transporter [bacterium]
MRAVYLALLAALVWGICPILEKAGLKNIPVYEGVFIRALSVFFAGVFMFLAKPSMFRTFTVPNVKAIIYIMLGGFFASIVGQMVYYKALSSGEASKIVPIAGAFPLVTFVLGIFVFGEAVTVTKIIGVILVVSGICLLK